jgi:hypothetical protein|nr:MAG TPA: hypothetical protein [Caudoviricetes sp.]
MQAVAIQNAIGKIVAAKKGSGFVLKQDLINAFYQYH